MEKRIAKYKRLMDTYTRNNRILWTAGTALATAGGVLDQWRVGLKPSQLDNYPQVVETTGDMISRIGLAIGSRNIALLWGDYVPSIYDTPHGIPTIFPFVYHANYTTPEVIGAGLFLVGLSLLMVRNARSFPDTKHAAARHAIKALAKERRKNLLRF